jgi:hypothetical protein
MHLWLLSFILFISSAYAHPVIYQDGVAISSSNMPSYAENYLMYSYSSKWAAGLGHYRFSNDKNNTELGLVKLNHLLWRHNGEDSQANIYLHGGLGVVDNEIGQRDTSEAMMAGIEGDWETRKLFTSLKHFEFHSPGVMDATMTQGRVGFSPLLTDFKDLQTWLMLQGMYAPTTDKTVTLTPLIRFFYHNVLWEMGSSFRGEWMLNFMVHY